jgi:hypothetical protein
MSLIGGNTNLKGALGFKGEKGDSAYQVAVKNGFIGTEKDWLATMGTTNYVGETKATFSATVGQKAFGLPTQYTNESIVEVYIEGAKLNKNLYTVNSSSRELTLTNAIAVNGTTVEIVLLTMASYELPIVETISSSSTNDTAPGTKAVYDFVMANKSGPTIVTIAGSESGIGAGETAIIDLDYPEGFTVHNTLIIGKMVSSNNAYYDSVDIEDTVSGFPKIVTIALIESGIRVWLKNTSTSEARIGHYKITLLREE